MKKRLFALVFLIAALANADGYVDTLSVLAGGAGGGGDDCSSAPTNILCIDLEPSATCSANGADTITGSPNCQFTTSPLEESVSIQMLDNGTNDALHWTNDFTTASDVRFTFHVSLDTTPTGTSPIVLARIWDGTSGAAVIVDSGSTDLAVQIPGAESVTITTAEDTEYIVCVEYNRDAAAATIRVDPGAGTPCAGAVGSANSGTGGTQPTSLTQVSFYDCRDLDTLDLCEVRIDDVLVEETTF